MTHEACHGRGAFAWIGLYEPTEEGFYSVTVEFEVEDSRMVEISRRTYEGSRGVQQFHRLTDLVVPTIITGIYAMNFEHMPGLAWNSGYPFALALMVVLSVLLCGGFKRYGWLS